MLAELPEGSAFEFTDHELQLVIDALQFELVHDEELCDPCAEEVTMLADLLLQHLMDKDRRRKDIDRLKGLFE